MRDDEFELILSMLDRLEVEQEQRLHAVLAAGDNEAAVAEPLESRLAPQPARLFTTTGE